MKLDTYPKVRAPKHYVDYADLEQGDLFWCFGDVFIKTGQLGSLEQTAISLTDGDYVDDMCGVLVTQVEAILNWKKIKGDKKC